MKKAKMLMMTLITLFAFTMGVNAEEVANEEDFISALNAGGEIKLNNDIEVSEIVIVNKDVQLNLNGHNIKFTNKKHIELEKGKLNITGEGKIYEAEPYYAPIYIASSASETDTSWATVTIGKDVTLEGWAGVMVKYKDSNYNAYGVTVNLYGKINAKNDTTGDHGAGIYVNGNIKKEVNAPVINVYDGAVITSTGHGIYGAGYATYNIFGGKITGDDTGVEIRAGKLNITGGEIVAKYVPDKATANGSGTTLLGVAVGVSQHTTKLPVDVKINGGTLSAYVPFYQANIQGNDAEAVEKVTLSVSGGTFNSTNTNEGKKAVYSENKKEFITGGTFNSELEENYLEENSAMAETSNGTLIVLDAEEFNEVMDIIDSLNEKDYTETSLNALATVLGKYDEDYKINSQEDLDKIVAEIKSAVEALETPEEEAARLEEEKKANEEVKNPKTGDNIFISFSIMLVSILTCIVLILNKNKLVKLLITK